METPTKDNRQSKASVHLLQTPDTVLKDAAENKKRERIHSLFQMMDKDTRDTVSLHDVALIIQNQMMSQNGPMAGASSVGPSVTPSPRNSRRISGMPRESSSSTSSGMMGGATSLASPNAGRSSTQRAPSPLERMSPTLKDRVRSEKFLEPLAIQIAEETGIIVQPGQDLTEVRIDFENFHRVMAETLDSNGEIAPFNSVAGAQARALTHLMTEIEDELQETIAEKQDLNQTLESRMHQYEANYEELLNTSTAQIAAAEQSFKKADSEARQYRTRLQQVEKMLEEAKAEVIEWKEKSKHERMPERKRLELEDMKSENQRLRTENEQLLGERNDALNALKLLQLDVTSKQKQIEALVRDVESFRGGDVQSLRAQLAEAHKRLELQEQLFQEQLRDAQDMIPRRSPSNVSRVTSPGGGQDLGAELAAALLENYTPGGGGGDRPPSHWGMNTPVSLSRKGSTKSRITRSNSGTSIRSSIRSSHSPPDLGPGPSRRSSIDPTAAIQLLKREHELALTEKDNEIAALMLDLQRAREQLRNNSNMSLDQTLTPSDYLRRSSRSTGDNNNNNNNNNNKLTGKVTVVVEKETVKRRIAANGEHLNTSVDKDAESQVYFTSSKVKMLNETPWSEAETRTLQQAARKAKLGPSGLGKSMNNRSSTIDWIAVAKSLPGRTNKACEAQWKSLHALQNYNNRGR